MRKHAFVLGGIYTLLCGLTLIPALWADPHNHDLPKFIVPVFLTGAALVLLPGLIGGRD